MIEKVMVLVYTNERCARCGAKIVIEAPLHRVQKDLLSEAALTICAAPHYDHDDASFEKFSMWSDLVKEAYILQDVAICPSCSAVLASMLDDINKEAEAQAMELKQAAKVIEGNRKARIRELITGNANG